MRLPTNSSDSSRNKLFAGAALALAVAVMAGGAAVLSDRIPDIAVTNPETQAAATWLGDVQGVPPDFTGRTYPDLLACYINWFFTYII